VNVGAGANGDDGERAADAGTPSDSSGSASGSEPESPTEHRPPGGGEEL
jgi:hypothetical protein